MKLIAGSHCATQLSTVELSASGGVNLLLRYDYAVYETHAVYARYR